MNKFKELSPKWCKYHRGYCAKGKRWGCCKCRKLSNDNIYQTGDGEQIHTLCKECREKELGEIKE